MGLQFIIGGSGTGKTTYMFNRMIKESIQNKKNIENIKYMAVVPEQFTMETQKTIVNLSPARGTMDIDILSFDRLAKRIFEEAGLNTLQVLDDTGKCLIIRKIIEENKNKLSVFGSKVNMAGFIDEMKSMVSELYQYGVGEKELEEMLKISESKPLLYAKLKDIKLIMEQLKIYLEDKFIMNEELLHRVCELIPNSELIKDSYIVFDEYTGFTPVQYKVIRYLLKYAGNVNIALTIREPDKIEFEKVNCETDVFGITIKTLNKLKNIAQEEQVELHGDIILKESYRLENNGELKYLEENLFKFGKKPYVVENDNISIHICEGIDAESEYVAYSIRNLVETGKYRYRDIAVVTSDIDTYHRTITESFKRHNIPCFIDHKRNIIANPMVEAIRAVLEIISENYSYESVFRYLKSGMSSLSRDEVDRLENFVIRCGIRGYKKYSSAFMTEDDKVNEAREKLMSDTGALYESFKADKDITVREAMILVYNMVSSLNMDIKMDKMKQYFEENNNLSMAKEYDQVYEKVMGLFDKIVFLIGDEKIRVKELAAILDSGFEDIKVGITPPTLDRVVVGDTERTRLNNVKVLFFVGINEGLVPKIDKKGGILTQSERSFLAENNVELSPTARENAFIQKYYLYLMLTKMSDRLYLSFKKMNGDGSSARQSYLINSLVKMFKGIQIIDEDNSNIRSSVDKITNVKSAKEYISGSIYDYISDTMKNEDKIIFREVYLACQRESIDFKDIIRATVYKNNPSKIDAAVAKAIYGDNLLNSVSRLERFAACAYEHFMSYGLALQPRREYEVSSADIGNIYHKAIELFFRKVNQRNISWNKMDGELRDMIINESVNEAVNESGNDVFSDSSRNAFTINRIKRMAKKTAWILQEQIIAGDFVPKDFELRFSSDYGLDELKYKFENGAVMGLKGIIDRVDYYSDGDDIYIKIVDYKSGNKKLEINDVYNGLQLQLVLYMEAAMELVKKRNPDKNIIPAGLFYYSIDNPVIMEKDINARKEVISADSTNIDEVKLKCANEMTLKSQRPEGFINGKEVIIRAIDENMEEASHSGGESLVAPVGFNSNGILKAGSKIISEYDMESLIKYVHNKVGELGEAILSGHIELNPYVKTNTKGNASEREKPCTYCEYKAVCGFDKKIRGCDYRILSKDKDEEVWEKIRKIEDNTLGKEY